jgi:hypothetical protein
MPLANDFYTKQLQRLVGQTVVATVSDAEGEFFGLLLQDTKGRQTALWLQSDDEGNGPGSFSMEKHPK